MKTYDFDNRIDRSGTHCKKTDLLQRDFGRDDLTPLWIADMDFAVCPDITRALVDRLSGHPVYGYTCTYDAYWQAIIDWQGRRNGFLFTRDEVTCLPGGVTAFGSVVNVLTRPGDKIVIQPPVYFDFNEVIVGNGRVPVCNDLVPTADGFFTMNLEELEQIFKTERPRLMVVCNPQNPIGISWDADVLRRVATLARQYGVILFSDEVFGDIMLYGHRHTPLATVNDDAAAVTITCGAPSKTFNIAGFKSTWLVVKNPELRQPLFHWIEVNELCTSNIIALTATEAAYRHGEQWLEQCISYIEGNVDYVVDYCREHISGVVAICPQATFLVWLDCSGLGLTHEQVIDLFVNRARLALNDGAIYGAPGQCHLRINVGSARSVLEHAMHQLEAAVKELGVKN